MSVIKIRRIVTGFVYSKIVVHIAICTESLAPRISHEAQPMCFGNCGVECEF
jgi:hypothetical protein